MKAATSVLLVDDDVALVSILRCRVKSRNERNPYSMLKFLRKLPRQNEEEGGDDV